MKLSLMVLVFTILLIQALAEARSFASLNEDEALEQRSYYYIVSEWSPCNCKTGKQYRTVKCTRSPCHFMRGPVPVRLCSC